MNEINIILLILIFFILIMTTTLTINYKKNKKQIKTNNENNVDSFKTINFNKEQYEYIQKLITNFKWKEIPKNPVDINFKRKPLLVGFHSYDCGFVFDLCYYCHDNQSWMYFNDCEKKSDYPYTHCFDPELLKEPPEKKVE